MMLPYFMLSGLEKRFLTVSERWNTIANRVRNIECKNNKVEPSHEYDFFGVYDFSAHMCSYMCIVHASGNLPAKSQARRLPRSVGATILDADIVQGQADWRCR